MDDAAKQALKDKLHDYLVVRCQRADRECQHFKGCIQKSSGLGVIGLHGKKYTAHRIAAWVWLKKDFDLDDKTVKVSRRKECVRCCVNPEHLTVRFMSEVEMEWRRERRKKRAEARRNRPKKIVARDEGPQIYLFPQWSQSS